VDGRSLAGSAAAAAAAAVDDDIAVDTDLRLHLRSDTDIASIQVLAA
jgi:hypothetical protein